MKSVPRQLLSQLRTQADGHQHRMRPFMGPIHMVIPDGHVVLKCIECPHMETKHVSAMKDVQ